VLIERPDAERLTRLPRLGIQVFRRQERHLDPVDPQTLRVQQPPPDMEAPEFVVGVDRVTLRIELKRIAPIPVVDPDDVVDEFLARLAPALRLLWGPAYGRRLS
jgi:hypothetical protein